MYRIIALFFILILFVPQYSYANSSVEINEFLAHPTTGNKEWVEIYNPISADLTKYWIDDDLDFVSDSGSSAKKSLATIKSGKDATHSYIELSSMLNNSGDYVVLFDATGNIVDQYQYTDDPGEDVVIGRSPDGSGQFFALQDQTLGDVNSIPVPTVTPTSAPTSIPTKTPTPTTAPPTKEPTIFKMPTSKITLIPTKKPMTIPNKLASIGGSLKDVLGTQSAKVSSASSKQKKEVINENKFQNWLTYVLISAGGLLFIGCGILIYWRKRVNETTTNHQ